MKIKDIFWVLFISMVPLIELRGAIPVGTILGLPFYLNFVLAVLGNLLPVPFILLLIPHILNIMERFKIFRPIVQWVRKKALKNQGKIAADIQQESLQESTRSNTDNDILNVPDNTKAERITQSAMPRGSFLGLLLFVLIPLPGTGAWTGALVASLFEFPKLKSFFAIALGVLGCGIIMCLASYGVLGFLSFLL